MAEGEGERRAAGPIFETNVGQAGGESRRADGPGEEFGVTVYDGDARGLAAPGRPAREHRAAVAVAGPTHFAPAVKVIIRRPGDVKAEVDGGAGADEEGLVAGRAREDLAPGRGRREENGDIHALAVVPHIRRDVAGDMRRVVGDDDGWTGGRRAAAIPRGYGGRAFRPGDAGHQRQFAEDVAGPRLAPAARADGYAEHDEKRRASATPSRDAGVR